MKLNERANELADSMIADAERLGVAVHKQPCGTRIVDCGVAVEGSRQAGLRLVEICTAGLATVVELPEQGAKTPTDGYLDPSPSYLPLRSPYIYISSNDPITACMASQYAGWRVSGHGYFAMGSGPMRAAAGGEELFNSIGHKESADRCVGVLESGSLPPDEICEDMAEQCGVSPDRLTLLVAPTASQAGTLQIVARSLETALHKLHVLGFDLSLVDSGYGIAPLPPVARDDLTAIGWTNDAILYGGQVTLSVCADAATIDDFGPRVPSCSSSDFGRPFAEIFHRYHGDFYQIDPMLFSPARISFVVEGHPGSRDFGRIVPDVLLNSFGLPQ